MAVYHSMLHYPLLSAPTRDKNDCTFKSVLRRQQMIYSQNSFGRSFRKSEYALQTLSDSGRDFIGHQGCVNTIDFDPRGQLLLSGSDDRSLVLWDVNTRSPKINLQGHCSNVFAAKFLPHKGNREIISGGNDADIRHYNMELGTCRVYRHHHRKVVKLAINPCTPDVFLSCSADGTVRMIDHRLDYGDTELQKLNEVYHESPHEYIVPQAYGGGRMLRGHREHKSSLLLNFRGERAHTLFSVDYHPYDGHTFLVASADGSVYVYDQRCIRNRAPHSYAARYCNDALDYDFEVTGAVFSSDGTQILASVLNNHLYLYNVEGKSPSVAMGMQLQKELMAHALPMPRWNEFLLRRNRRQIRAQQVRRRRIHTGNTLHHQSNPRSVRPARRLLHTEAAFWSRHQPREAHEMDREPSAESSLLASSSLGNTEQLVKRPPASQSVSIPNRSHSGKKEGRTISSPSSSPIRSGSSIKAGLNFRQEARPPSPMYEVPKKRPRSASHDDQAKPSCDHSLKDFPTLDPWPSRKREETSSLSFAENACHEKEKRKADCHPAALLSSSSQKDRCHIRDREQEDLPVNLCSSAPMTILSGAMKPTASALVVSFDSGGKDAQRVGVSSSRKQKERGAAQSAPGRIGDSFLVTTHELDSSMRHVLALHGAGVMNRKLVDICRGTDVTKDMILSDASLPSPGRSSMRTHSSSSGMFAIQAMATEETESLERNAVVSVSRDETEEREQDHEDREMRTGLYPIGLEPIASPYYIREEVARDETSSSDSSDSSSESESGSDRDEDQDHMEDESSEEDEDNEDRYDLYGLPSDDMHIELHDDLMMNSIQRAPPSLKKTYTRVFKGHHSISTIKSCSFFGPNSEYVVSGSDCGRVFIWDRRFGTLLRVLRGHDSVVNCVVQHPNEPSLATSGIDHYVKLWTPGGNLPDRKEEQIRARRRRAACAQSRRAYRRYWYGRH